MRGRSWPSGQVGRDPDVLISSRTAFHPVCSMLTEPRARSIPSIVRSVVNTSTSRFGMPWAAAAADDRVQQVRAEPAARGRRHGDGQLAVAVGEWNEPGLAEQRPFVAVTVDGDGHEARPSPRSHRRHTLDEVGWRPVLLEEAALAVVGGEAVEQRYQRVGIVGGDGSDQMP